MRILALSPHPDDIEMGCGGFLAKHVEDEILIVYFSLCEESMTDFLDDTLLSELEDAVSVLDATCNVEGYKVRRFSESRQQILEGLVEIRDEFQPDLVLIPSGSDIHQDHRVIHEEGKRAFKFFDTLAYESPWNCRGFTPNHFEELSEAHVAKKLQLTQCYQSQVHLRRKYFEKESIEATLRIRGSQSGLKFAEGYEVITKINKT